jgi:hypothetical protein
MRRLAAAIIIAVVALAASGEASALLGEAKRQPQPLRKMARRPR